MLRPNFQQNKVLNLNGGSIYKYSLRSFPKLEVQKNSPILRAGSPKKIDGNHPIPSRPRIHIPPGGKKVPKIIDS